jgi:TonB-linked SusC/RagA family outer membrane protein
MNRKFYRYLWAIFIVVLNAELSHASPHFWQDHVIEGTVLASSGESLPGVSIVVQGTANGTVTDANGQFRISVPASTSTLTFTYIGYTSQDIIVGDRTRIDVTLEPSLEQLDEVVVIGYGTVKKSDLTGSVSSVKGDELKAVPTTSFDQALQGRAAGVQVMQTSGAPGAEASIRIRGVSSITAANEPLYVIDGMLINSSTSDVTAGGLVGSAPRVGPLASINPNDIESIEILKDASATAIYGSRGANGVIMITTKHGKKGTGTINFDSYIGFQQPTKTIKMLNASQFAEMVNDARINGGQQPEYVNPSNMGTGTDWQKELFRTAPMQNYQLSMTGGSEKTQYAVSGGYFDQEGIVVNTDFKRYSFRTNLNSQITKRFSVGTNLMYAYTSGNSVNTGTQQITPGVIGAALGMDPILSVYNPNQTGGYTYENDRGTVIGNPVAEAMAHQAKSTNSRILGNVEGRLKITDWLDIRSSFGIDANQSKDRTFAPNWLKAAQGSKGEAGIATLEAMTWLNENTVNFNKTFDNGHNLTAVLGYTAQQFHNERLVAYAFGIDDERLGYHNLSIASKPQPPSNGETSWQMQSYLGRAQYSVNSKYLFTVTGRVDGSSKFGKNNKYAFFPSAAAAWALHEEEFLKSAGFLSELKLRTSIGTIGNQAINPYQSLPLVGPYGQGVFNNGANPPAYYTSSQPTSYNNPNLKWETTRQFNIGLDAAAFSGRVQLTVDWFQKYTYDLLLNTPIPVTSGFESTVLNVGNIKNHGIDVEVRTVNLQGRVKWNTSVNFSSYRNEITKLATPTDVLLGSGLMLREGQPIGTFYGYKFDGIFQTDDEAANSAVLNGQQNTPANAATRARAGDRKYVDVTPDGVIDDKDRTILGNALPKFTWGMNNNISYGPFNLSIFVQGSYGNKMANLNSIPMEDFRGTQNVSAEAGLNRWTPSNPGNRYPRALANRTIDVGTFSSTVIEDASYARLKNVTFSYNLPASLLQRINTKSVRVYVSGTNLVTLTKYTGFDPEGSSFGTLTAYPGVDQGRYPLTKTYVVGLNIGL